MAAAWLHPLLRLLYIGAYVGNDNGAAPARHLTGLKTLSPAKSPSPNPNNHKC